MFQSNVSLPFGLGRSHQPGLRSPWRVQQKPVLRWEALFNGGSCGPLLEATLLAFGEKLVVGTNLHILV